MSECTWYKTSYLEDQGSSPVSESFSLVRPWCKYDQGLNSTGEKHHLKTVYSFISTGIANCRRSQRIRSFSGLPLVGWLNESFWNPRVKSVLRLLISYRINNWLTVSHIICQSILIKSSTPRIPPNRPWSTLLHPGGHFYLYHNTIK